MSQKNLSTVATEVIGAYGITATNVINAYRFGGERFIGFMDERFANAVNSGNSTFSKGLRANLVDGQKRVSGYSVKGLHLSSDGAQRAVGVAVDLATKGVDVVASNAIRVDRATKLNAIDTINRVAMPVAQFASQVADRLEAGSSELVVRVSGKEVPAKAVATRKLKTTTRKAAATRKQVTRQVSKAADQQMKKAVAVGEQISDAASEQLDKAVATRKRVTRAATKRVSKVVAETAIDTSNAARRVARKAKATAAAA